MGKGDHIFRRGAFGTDRLGLLSCEHHAIDTGDGTVVEHHMGGDFSVECASPARPASI